MGNENIKKVESVLETFIKEKGYDLEVEDIRHARRGIDYRVIMKRRNACNWKQFEEGQFKRKWFDDYTGSGEARRAIEDGIEQINNKIRAKELKAENI